MNNNIRIPGQKVNQVNRLQTPAGAKTSPADISFSQVWQETLQKQSAVKFSAHALQRLQVRQIELNPSDLVKINDAVAAAGRKGARSSLLLYDDLALVASINNRTIITAMNGDELQEHIFTNIDSAVIIK